MKVTKTAAIWTGVKDFPKKEAAPKVPQKSLKKKA